MNYKFSFRQMGDGDHKTQENGQSLLEFALILGLMLVFLFGTIEIANLLQQKADLDNIVKQAAKQAGEFGGGRDEVEAYISKQMEYMGYPLASADEVDITTTLTTLTLEAQEFNGTTFTPVSPASETCTYGQFITVTMTVDARVNIPSFLFFNEFIRNSIPLTVSNNARCWRS